MTIPGIDVLELERFQRLEHHEMFRRLRAEAPVSWHDHPGGRGFWNVVKHEDVVMVGRQAQMFSSESGGVSILDPEEFEGGMTMARELLFEPELVVRSSTGAVPKP